jgi:AAA+ ATPase superfamily predicted ATPase
MIGRNEEVKIMQQLLQSSKAEMLAVYGRRRVGKTYLIKNVYQPNLSFEFTGTQNATLKNQLFKFSDIIFTKKTNYSIGVSPQSQRLVLTDKSGGQYLFMLNVAFNIPDGHRDLYLSWLPYNKQQAVAAFDYNEVNGFGYFCFKVE